MILTKIVHSPAREQENQHVLVTPACAIYHSALLARTCLALIHLVHSNTVELYPILYLRTHPALGCHQALRGPSLLWTLMTIPFRTVHISISTLWIVLGLACQRLQHFGIIIQTMTLPFCHPGQIVKEQGMRQSSMNVCHQNPLVAIEKLVSIRLPRGYITTLMSASQRTAFVPMILHIASTSQISQASPPQTRMHHPSC